MELTWFRRWIPAQLIDGMGATLARCPQRQRGSRRQRVFRKVLRGTSANLAVQGSNILLQLGAVPLFLHVWNAETYGAWLMLTAISVQALLLDGGMVAAAMNEIVMRTARDEKPGAARMLAVGLTITSLIAVACLAVAIPLILLIDRGPLATADGKHALILLTAAALLHLYSGLFDGIFRAIDRYAQGVLVMQAAPLAEFVGGALGLLLAGSFTAVAAGVLGGRILHLLTLRILLARAAPALPWRLTTSGLGEARQLVRPGLAWMGFRISDALSLQGATLLVGALFGSGAVAAYNTSRTLSRLLYQFVGGLGNALWPEFSRLGATGDWATARVVAWRATWISVGAAGLGGLVILAVGPWLLSWWTHQQVAPDPLLLGLLLLHTLIAVAWYVPKMFFAATNRIGELSRANLVIAALALGAAWLLGRASGQGAFLMALISGEALIAVLACHLFRKHLHERY